MSASPAFADYVLELLAPLGEVSARRMFGGYGIYCDGVMFALIANEVLYLKADDGNRPALEHAGSEPFTYEAKGRRTALSYWRAPDEAMESPGLAAEWARAAYAAALRARQLPGAGRRRPSGKSASPERPPSRARLTRRK